MIKAISICLNSLLMLGVLGACQKNDNGYDASGVFESTELLISAESSGLLKEFNIREGDSVIAGQYLGYIDTIQLHLKKKQLLAQVKSTLAQKPDIHKQIAALQVQLSAAEREKQRIEKLYESGAATRKQLDDMNSQVELIRGQLEAQRSALQVNSGAITEQSNPLMIQVEQLNDQIARSVLRAPISGTILSKLAEQNELIAAGKPVYKIADLSSLVLRAYVSAAQLSQIKNGQKLKVLVDQAGENYKEYEGTVEWISNKAEFTPKSIQTKDERSNLVYAVKLRVKNDGYLKIGMYADVKF